jgi:cell division protein FtsI/penicillin-binding protein 2
LLRNRAITDAYEPGSTMKPFTIAMALESGKWTPTTRVDTRGPLKVGRYLVRDVHNYGLIDVTHVISKSSNVGTSKIALSLPMEQLWKLYKDLGFGALTGLGWSASNPAYCGISANGAAKSATPTIRLVTGCPSTCCNWPRPTRCWRRMAFGGP